MSFLSSLADELTEGISTIAGLLNLNDEEDDPARKERNKLIVQANAGRRFQSFAEERDNNFVKWHIDGHDYFRAVSELLENARHSIYILDWWLTPELMLRRPCEYHQDFRLDKVLKRKAEQGVKIYVVLYNEIPFTLSTSSEHSKHALEALHPNIAVMRHPEHIGSVDSVEFWAHHEKVVVVDNHFACIGGLDLCLGRWDTHNHPLADVHPTEFGRTLFPGQDYNNARVLDFKDVKDYVGSTVSALETPRMPWHDTHMTLIGPCVMDISKHFLERWNMIKRRKYKDNNRYEYLTVPHYAEPLPNDAITRHPHRDQVDRYLHGGNHGTAGHPVHGSCHVQVVRSVCDWSHNVPTEKSIQNAYCQLILEAQHFIYIENQFFISTTQNSGPVVNKIAAALVERIVRAAREGRKFKVVVVLPEVPGFSGDITATTSISTILAGQYRTINRGGHSIFEEVKKAGYDANDYISFYHLRAYDRINAPWDSYIKKMEKISGVSFYDAEVAQAREWIGDTWGSGTEKEVKIVEFQGNQGLKTMNRNGDKSDTKTRNIRMPESLREAQDIVEGFEAASLEIRGDEDVSDTVGQHAMMDKTSLKGEKWMGTEREELYAYVSGLVYIHAKLMIVDDRRVIMGSANLNDRSMKGDGDSEIALVVEDQDLIETTMDGKQYFAARFAATLRRKLWREHLGLMEPQTCQDPDEPITSFMRPAPVRNDDETHLREDRAVADPLADATWALWTNTARKNKRIFEELYKPVPTNLAKTKEAYRKYLPNVKPGHVVDGFSVAYVKEQLSQVRGHLVEYPTQFLIDDKDFVEGPDWLGLNPTLPIYI